MSKRILAQFYVPVYRDLMMVPDYVKNFQSKSIGSMYTIIVSRIWRKGFAWSKQEGYYGFIERCAKEYDNGHLTAYMDDEELADLLGVGERHVRRLRDQLVELGLVEATKDGYHGTGNFYRLGEVLSQNEYGNHNEVLYIEKWLKQIDDERDSGGGNVDPNNLPFVQSIRKTLVSPSAKKKTTPKGERVIRRKESSSSNQADPAPLDPHLAIQSQISGHTEPDQAPKPRREEPVQDGETQPQENPYNNKKIKGITSNSTTTVATQGSLWEESVDLSYINEGITPSKLGQALVREHGRVGEEALKAYLRSLLKEKGMQLPSQTAGVLFYSTFVDVWLKRFPPPPSSKLSTSIIAWWKALALDLERNDLLANPKRNMIAASQIKGVSNWFEFSFLLKEMFNNNGGYRHFQDFKHITWLQTSINKDLYKLSEFRKLTKGSNLKNAVPVNVDKVQEELDARLAEAMRQFQQDEDSDDGLDLDSILSL